MSDERPTPTSDFLELRGAFGMTLLDIRKMLGPAIGSCEIARDESEGLFGELDDFAECLGESQRLQLRELVSKRREALLEMHALSSETLLAAHSFVQRLDAELRTGKPPSEWMQSPPTSGTPLNSSHDAEPLGGAANG